MTSPQKPEGQHVAADDTTRESLISRPVKCYDEEGVLLSRCFSCVLELMEDAASPQQHPVCRVWMND